MAEKVEWSNFGNGNRLPRKGGANGDTPLRPLKFIKIVSGSPVRVRPLLSAVNFFKYVVPHGGGFRSAICGNPETCPIFTKHDIQPQDRYAINVIDRADGEIKILEGSFNVFGQFHEYFKHTGINPGKGQGADFVISATGEGLMKRYKCEFADRTTLTPAEREMIKTEKPYNLERIFKVTPPEEIEAKLFGEQVQKKAAAPAAPTETDLMDGFDDDASPAAAEATGSSFSDDDLSDELDI